MLIIEEGKLKKEKAKEMCGVATSSILLSVWAVPADANGGSPRPLLILPLIITSVSGKLVGNVCK